VLLMLVVALIFGIVNAIVKPIFKLVSLPIVIVTLGLFLVVINALMLMLTSWLSGLFDLGWHVEGFWTAVLGGLIVAVVSWLLNAFVPDKNEDRRHR
jgi:putative membrane protein